MLESITTGGRAPEDLLDRLNSYDIEWYVTEKGDLFIRYWQLGAEDFVPAEHAGVIRMKQEIPPAADYLEWISAHLEHLKAEHASGSSRAIWRRRARRDALPLRRRSVRCEPTTRSARSSAPLARRLTRPSGL